MERREAAKGAAWLQWRKMPGRSTKEEGKEGEGKRGRREKEELGVKSLKKWLQASRRRYVCMMVKIVTLKRPAEQSFMRSWDCSQIEN